MNMNKLLITLAMSGLLIAGSGVRSYAAEADINDLLQVQASDTSEAEEANETETTISLENPASVQDIDSLTAASESNNIDLVSNRISNEAVVTDTSTEEAPVAAGEDSSAGETESKGGVIAEQETSGADSNKAEETINSDNEEENSKEDSEDSSKEVNSIEDSTKEVSNLEDSNKEKNSKEDSNKEDTTEENSSEEAVVKEDSSRESSKEDTKEKSNEEDKTEEEPSYSKSDLRLLTCLIYAEAGNQSYKGMLAVANVVLNRVKSDVYWHVDTIKEVIYDDKWSIQFAVTIKNKKTGKSMLDKALESYDTGKFSSSNPEAEKKAMKQAKKAAKAALEGENNIGSFLCFNGINSGTKKIKQKYSYKIIGDHIFYRSE